MNASESESRLSDAAAKAAYAKVKEVILEDSDDPDISGAVVVVLITKHVTDKNAQRHEFFGSWTCGWVNVDVDNGLTDEEKIERGRFCEGLVSVVQDAVVNYSEE